MSTPRSQANEDAVAILASSHPAKMRDRTTTPVVPVRADQSAFEQGGKDFAWAT
ncbi:MAG TPA: hypothetical protein VIM47_07875 [Dermatophilaceae bacterium]